MKTYLPIQNQNENLLTYTKQIGLDERRVLNGPSSFARILSNRRANQSSSSKMRQKITKRTGQCTNRNHHRFGPIN